MINTAVTPNTVTFTHTIPTANLSDFGWWGFCLKPISGDGDEMTGSDCVTIIKDSGLIDDRWASSNGRPTSDTTDNLTSTSSTTAGTNRVSMWTRPLDTSDSQDIALVVGNQYHILWAMSTVENNLIMQHVEGNRGHEVITFTNDYADTGSDDEDDDNSIYYALTLVLLAVISLV